MIPTRSAAVRSVLRSVNRAAAASRSRTPLRQLPAVAAAGLSTSRSVAQGHLPGHPDSPYLTSLETSFFDSVRANEGSVQGADGRPGTGIPTFRLMDGTGKLLEGVSEESLEVSAHMACELTGSRKATC